MIETILLIAIALLLIPLGLLVLICLPSALADYDPNRED